MVDDLMENIPIEIATKKIMDNLGTANTLDMIKNLVQLRKGLIAGKVSDVIWEKALQISSDIIKEDSDIKIRAIIDVFKGSGIITENGLAVFKSMVGDNYTKGDAEDIILRSEKTFKDIENLMELYDEGAITNLKMDYDLLKNILKTQDQIISKLRKEL
jgi:hypothetical protein